MNQYNITVRDEQRKRICEKELTNERVKRVNILKFKEISWREISSRDSTATILEMRFENS